MEDKVKTTHLIGAGGPAGVGMTRCLKDHYRVTGDDSSAWGELMMECDIPTFEVIPDLVLPLPDSVIGCHNIRFPTFLPPKEQIELCQDKAKTAELLGNLAPKTYWVRDTVGAGGKGAQMASEVLTGRNYSHEFVFFHGECLAEFQKQRVSYSLKHTTIGLENRGSSVVSVCTWFDSVTDVATAALHKLPGELHGFYGVDMVEDENGTPKVTEINAGRLLTASYSFFWLTGYNLPLVGVRAFLEEEAPILPEYPLWYGIVRQIDQLPRLIEPSETESWTGKRVPDPAKNSVISPT